MTFRDVSRHTILFREHTRAEVRKKEKRGERPPQAPPPPLRPRDRHKPGPFGGVAGGDPTARAGVAGTLLDAAFAPRVDDSPRRVGTACIRRVRLPGPRVKGS